MSGTMYTRALRFVGIGELVEGEHPLIQWWLSLCGFDPGTVQDEVPWCSAFVNGIAWDLRYPRSKSAMARSWLGVGLPIPLAEAVAGNDVVVFWRGSVDAPTGHVGLFSGREGDNVLALGGNQGNQVCIAPYPRDRVIGVRRLA